jgi:hypothetical protein
MDTWVVYFHDWKQHSLKHEFSSEGEALRETCQLRLGHHRTAEALGADGVAKSPEHQAQSVHVCLAARLRRMYSRM